MTRHVAALQDLISGGSDAEVSAEQEWEWAAADEAPKPDADDHGLRRAAQQMQASIGSHRTLELGSSIPGFDNMEALSWADKLSDPVTFCPFQTGP